MTAILNNQNNQLSHYNTYLYLKSLKYSNDCISKHLNYSFEQLGYLISCYHFKNNIEYLFEVSNKQYDNCFNGYFEVSQAVCNILTKNEILEIKNFIDELVIQHNGIYHTQKFYSIEQDCQLMYIDDVSNNRCVFLLSN